MLFISLMKEKSLFNRLTIKDKLILQKMIVLDKVLLEPKEEENTLSLLFRELFAQSFQNKTSKEVLVQKEKTFIFTILESGL